MQSFNRWYAAVSLLIVATAYFVVRLHRQRRRFRNLPGPPHDFVWGHLKVMGEIASEFPPNTHPQAYMTALAQKYQLKGVYYLDLWPVAISQAIICDAALQDVVYRLPKHQIEQDSLAPIIGGNPMAVVNGPAWKEPRKAMTPAFTVAHAQNLSGVLTSETVVFAQRLFELADSGDQFSILTLTKNLMYEIIAQIVFNTRLNAQHEGSDLLNALDGMMKLADQSIMYSFNPLQKLKTYFSIKGINARTRPAIEKRIKDRFDLLKEKRTVPSRADPDSVLDLMLRDELQKLAATKDVSRKGTLPALSEAYVASMSDNLKSLVAGGTLTTSESLSFTYMLIASHPAVVAKLREEHEKLLPGTIEATAALLKQEPGLVRDMTYTEAVIKETLRLFPTGFGLRKAEQDATLLYNGATYPLGDLAVGAVSQTLHYDPSYFPEPTKFKPERFLGPDGSAKSALMRSFGKGPRACIAQNLVWQNLKTALALTVRFMDFELVGLKPNEKPRTCWTDLDTVYGDVVFQELAMTAKPRGDIRMRVRRREVAEKA